MTAYVAMYSDPGVVPAAWAACREAEGWDGVAVPDHVWVTGRPVRHLWVTLAEMAVATSAVRLASGFANNLARSPVEFAHAALTLQALSGGRFEAGLGAGWDSAEAVATALPFPGAGERSQRLAEALAIARSLFHTGACTLSGRWYDVDVPTIGPRVQGAPTLISSATGRITMSRIIREVDVLELQPPGFSVPGHGSMEVPVVTQVTTGDIRARIELARSLRPGVVLGTFLVYGCGDDPMVDRLRDRLNGSPFASLFGEPGQVADEVRRVAELGYERVQLGGVTASSPALLAPELLTPR